MMLNNSSILITSEDDILKLDGVKKAIRGFDALIHLAELIAISFSYNNIKYFFIIKKIILRCQK